VAIQGGVSKGARRKLSDALIRTLARDRQAHGEEVIQRVRQDNPVAYFKGMLSLVQKDVSLEGEIKRPQNPAGIRARTEKEASLKRDGLSQKKQRRVANSHPSHTLPCDGFATPCAVTHCLA
jgi:hypothetical protein